MAEPHPKSKQLARGERRYRRKVASPKQWAAVRAEKLTVCRLIGRDCDGQLELHHLVSRGALGDDVADNLVPLCQLHHTLVSMRDPHALHDLAGLLEDGEYAFVVGRLGEGAMSRLFGV